MNNKNYIVVIVILIVSCLFILKIEQAKGTVYHSTKLGNFPFQIGQWQGKDLEVSPETYEILGTKDVIVRGYQNPQGHKVTLAIVSSGMNRDSIHPPEYCYLGGGVRLSQKEIETIGVSETETIEANKLVMSHPEGTIKAWYWYSGKDTFYSNYYLQQLAILWDALRGKKLESALIRVSVFGDDLELENQAKSFIKEVVPAIKETL